MSLTLTQIVDARADEIRRLERLVYGRADTPQQVAARDQATEQLIALRAREEHVPEASAAASVAEAPTRRPGWMLPAIVLGATAVVLAVVIWQLAPQAPERALPTSAASVASTTAPPTAPPEVPVAIVPPDGDFPLPPEDFPLRAPGPNGDGAVVDQWGLGVRDGITAYGYTASNDLVCIAVAESETRSGKCVATADFLRDGLTIDRGAWTVFWYADGRVIWEG